LFNKSCTLAVLILALSAANANGQEPDSDHDGVPDALDKCPNTRQLKKLPADFKYAPAVDSERLKPGAQAHPVDKNGCEPDADGDGVVDSQDYCPDDSKQALSRGIAENGCPRHSDQDGTPDYRDKCPGTPKGVKTDQFGCP
jgi:OOP family OmpA-OmpF porin